MFILWLMIFFFFLFIYFFVYLFIYLFLLFIFFFCLFIFFFFKERLFITLLCSSFFCKVAWCRGSIRDFGSRDPSSNLGVTTFLTGGQVGQVEIYFNCQGIRRCIKNVVIKLQLVFREHYS